MPMTAMIRNLGKMTSLGPIKPFSDAAELVVNKLKDETALKRARIHSLAVLIAEKVYAQGHGEKGSLTWKPVSKIVDALDAAFYATFGNVEPCGKPVLLALDVSGSIDGSSTTGSTFHSSIVSIDSDPRKRNRCFGTPLRASARMHSC